MNEQDSRVEVVRECLTEEDNSILAAFFCERSYNLKTSNEFIG